MRKSILFIAMLFAISMTASAQKFALIDTEYILKNIPTYQSVNDQLSQASKQWQGEVETASKELQTLYQNYEKEVNTLNAANKKKREDDIIAKEKAVKDLSMKYFGPEGELAKKREALMKPIQDDIYNAVKAISEQNGYALVVDRASASSVIFASPRIDISNEVLSKLGYSN